MSRVPIYIQQDLHDKIKRRVEQSKGEFKSVEEYVEFVLEEVVKEEEGSERAYTPEEEEEIKERLRRLGYL